MTLEDLIEESEERVAEERARLIASGEATATELDILEAELEAAAEREPTPEERAAFTALWEALTRVVH